MGGGQRRARREYELCRPRRSDIAADAGGRRRQRHGADRGGRQCRAAIRAALPGGRSQRDRRDRDRLRRRVSSPWPIAAAISRWRRPASIFLRWRPAKPMQLTTGTSIAAAHVSGIAALLLERKPSLKPATSARSDRHGQRPDRRFRIGSGAGLVNAYRAVTWLDRKPAGAAQREAIIVRIAPCRGFEPRRAAACLTGAFDLSPKPAERRQPRGAVP